MTIQKQKDASDKDDVIMAVEKDVDTPGATSSKGTASIPPQNAFANYAADVNASGFEQWHQNEINR